MEVSLLLMQQIAQLFIVLIMGYVVVKAGLLKASDSKVLSVVFVYLVMSSSQNYHRHHEPGSHPQSHTKYQTS